MHPHLRHALGVEGAAGLGGLVLVVREDQVDAAAVDVEGLAQVLPGHGRALDVPAGAAGRGDAAGAVPGRLAGLRRLPQDEIHRVLLVGRDVDAGTGLHLVEGTAGELAVFGHRGHVEQDVVLGHIGMAARDQLLDQRLHLADMLGRARLHRGAQAAERVDVLVILALGQRGDLADRRVERQVGIVPGGARVDLVVDVGDVADVFDVVGAVDVAQEPEQHVEDDRRSGVADMGEIVDRRPAHIHAHICRVERTEFRLRPRQRVVKPQTHVKPSPACRPGRPSVLKLSGNKERPRPACALAANNDRANDNSA